MSLRSLRLSIRVFVRHLLSDNFFRSFFVFAVFASFMSNHTRVMICIHKSAFRPPRATARNLSVLPGFSSFFSFFLLVHTTKCSGKSNGFATIPHKSAIQLVFDQMWMLFQLSVVHGTIIMISIYRFRSRTWSRFPFPLYLTPIELWHLHELVRRSMRASKDQRYVPIKD